LAGKSVNIVHIFILENLFEPYIPTRAGSPILWCACIVPTWSTPKIPIAGCIFVFRLGGMMLRRKNKYLWVHEARPKSLSQDGASHVSWLRTEDLCWEFGRVFVFNVSVLCTYDAYVTCVFINYVWFEAGAACTFFCASVRIVKA
jgi:hypothetical protein